MSLKAQILGKVRGIMMDLLPTGDDEIQPHLSGQGEQLIAFGAAPYQEIVRQGRSFIVNTTTAVASVTSIPTTAYAFAIYNAEADGGRSLIIDQVGALFVASPSIIPHIGIIGCLGLVREALPTCQTTIIPRQLNGMGNSDTKVRVIVAADNPYAGGAGTVLSNTGIAGNWFPLGDSVIGAVTSLPGFQKVFNVDGRIIVPPGRLFLLHTLGAKVDVTAQLFVSWHEKVILNG